MKKIFLLFSLALAYTINLTTNAEVRFVSKTGSSTPPYTSWASAADSIQKCIDISSRGDTILVANGVYKETIELSPTMTLLGSGIDSCIIDTRDFPNKPPTFRAVGIYDSCTISGFHIIVSEMENNGEFIGGGIKIRRFEGNISRNVIIENNRISNSKTAITNLWNEVKIRNNIINNAVFAIDVAELGDGLSTLIENNIILLSNFSAHTGIYIQFGSPLLHIVNNLIAITNSEKMTGIFTVSGDSCYIANNTILYLAEPRLVLYGINAYVGKRKILNNVIYGDFITNGIQVLDNEIVKNNTLTGSTKGVTAYGAVSNLIYQYNNVWDVNVTYSGFIPDTTNISADPMFENVDSMNVHLQKYSPLINAGDPSIRDVDDSRSDIGSLGGPLGQSYVYIDKAPREPILISASFDSTKIEINWKKNTEADFNHYNVYRDSVNGFIPDSTKLIFSTSDTTYTGTLPNSNKIYYKVTAIDNQYNESIPSEEISVILTGIKNKNRNIISYELYQNYPNPFNPGTKIGYRLQQAGYVKLGVFDIQGEKVDDLVSKFQDAGYYEVEFNVNSKDKNIASGIYIYRIEIKGDNNIPVYTEIKKMVMIK
jgi:hypothetical protein